MAKFGPDGGNVLDNLTSPYYVPSPQVSLKLGFESAKSDPFSDLQLMAAKSYEKPSLFNGQLDHYAVVLRVENTPGPGSSDNIAEKPKVVVRARVPILHSHLPAPRGSNDNDIIEMYPKFSAWKMEDIGGVAPTEGSVIRVSFADQKFPCRIEGNGILLGLVSEGIPGLTEAPGSVSSTFGFPLNSNGELIRKCKDLRSEAVIEPSGQGADSGQMDTKSVSQRNPRKLDSPHSTGGAQPKTPTPEENNKKPRPAQSRQSPTESAEDEERIIGYDGKPSAQSEELDCDKVYSMLDVIGGRGNNKDVPTYRVTSNFQPSRRSPVDGKVRNHNGTDTGIPVGTPLYSPYAEGQVVKIFNDAINGYGVKVYYPKEKMTVAMVHMSRVMVKKEQIVKQYDVLGLSGGGFLDKARTIRQPGAGRSTGPHLHIAVKTGVNNRRQRGKWTDPAKIKGLLENVHLAKIKRKAYKYG